MRRLGNLARVRPSRRAVLRAAATSSPARFALNQATRVPEPREYRLRGSALRFVVQHGTEDVSALTEIWAEREYAPPPAVTARLRGAPRLRVLDLGANVGLFALWVLRRRPDARVTSVEPDPRNLALLERARALNPQCDWTVEAAAAGAAPGTVTLDHGLRTGSRVADVPYGIPVERIDVLPRLARFDLVKCDIEGSEWPILEDERLAEAAPATLVLEYHPREGGARDAGAHAAGLLRRAGLAVDGPHEKAAGAGLLWAWRPGAEGPLRPR